MDKKSDKSFSSIIVYFILALGFALLSILVRRPPSITYERLSLSIGLDTRWFFWILLALSAICLVPLIVAALRGLHERKLLPKSLDFFFADESKSAREDLLARMRERTFGRIGMTMITGCAILLLSLFLARTDAVDDDRINGNVYEVVLRMLGMQHMSYQFSKVAQVMYLTPSTDPESQLRDLLKIVNTLKGAGAKAVLITLPEFPPDGATALHLWREIENTGIVVWGIARPSYRESDARTRDSVWAVMPSVVLYYTNDDDLWRGPNLVRLWRADAVLELLETYKQYPRHLYSRSLFGNEIEFGEYKIKLSSDGWSYALDRYTSSRYPVLYAHRGDAWRIGHTVWGGTPIHGETSTEYEGSGEKPDTLAYSTYNYNSGGSNRWLSMDKSSIDGKVDGKIVLLAGNYGSSAGNYPPDRAYAVWLESILRGHMMHKPALGFFWMSLACLVLAGFFAYRFRPLAAILLMFILMLCALMAGSYLFDRQDMLVDIFYPLLSIAIAMIVFPTISVLRREQDIRPLS